MSASAAVAAEVVQRSPCGHNGSKRDVICLDHVVYQDRCAKCCSECVEQNVPQNAVATGMVKDVRDMRGRFGVGNQPRNPGGRPRKLRDIEKMLNTEHRNLPVMRETFARLRALAMGETVIVPFINSEGEMQLRAELHADARFMSLYLDRLLGPAKAFDDTIDFSSAPAEVLQWLQKYFSGA